MNQNLYPYEGSSMSGQVIPRAEIRRRVREQIEAGIFPDGWGEQVETAVTVVTDAYTAPERNRMRIGGIWRSVAEVQETFAGLTHEHVYTVIDKLIREGYEPRYREAYFRAALFNEAREAAGRAELAYLQERAAAYD